MSKEKTIKAIQVVPVSNGFILNTQETLNPQVPPKVEQIYFETAAEACQAGAYFLEPNVVQFVTCGN